MGNLEEDMLSKLLLSKEIRQEYFVLVKGRKPICRLEVHMMVLFFLHILGRLLEQQKEFMEMIFWNYCIKDLSNLLHHINLIQDAILNQLSGNLRFKIYALKMLIKI